MTDNSILDALRNTPMGQLRYDRDWDSEGRVSEIIGDLRTRVDSLTISPKTVVSKLNTTRIIRKKANYDGDDELRINFLAPRSSFNKSVNRIGFTKHDASIENELEMFEKARIEKVREEVESRANELYSNVREMEEEAEEVMRAIRQKHLLSTLNRIKAYKVEHEAFMTELTNQQLQLKSDNVSIRLREIENKHKQVIAEREKLTHEQNSKLIQQVKSNVDSISNELVSALKPYLSSNDPRVQNCAKQPEALIEKASAIISQLSNKQLLTTEDVNLAETVRTELNALKHNLPNILKNTTVSSQPLNVQIVSPPRQADSVSSGKVLKIPDHCLKEYVGHHEFLNQFDKNLEQFIADPAVKAYRLTLQQFIRTTINTISSGSNEHLKDKYRRLSSLLEGNVLEFQEKRFKATDHPESLNFCISFAVKTFLSVGGKQVQSVPKAAYPMAAIIVLIWQKYPLFGKVFLASLYEKCPYLSGYYPVRESGDSDVAYLIACGYIYGSDNETLETEESFHNRMRALTRIYGAIIQSSITDIHPHGPGQGWECLSKLLNQDPRPGTTAAILHAFLTSSMFKMLTTYRKQMVKLIAFIHSDYIKRIETVSVHEVKKQSLVQLKMFLDDVLKKMNRNQASLKPEGVLPDYFFEKTFLHSYGARH
ncbi:Nucleoporin GLE1 [Halotydeus destructor]|nr:Nucleoporin GLE1 [Halotydeus destructor]